MFAQEVEKDVRKLLPGTLFAFRDRIIAEGTAAIREHGATLRARHYPAREIPLILSLLEERYVVRWTQQVAAAFAVAFDAVPEARNPVRARDVSGTQVSIPERLQEAIGVSTLAPRKTGRTLFGIFRASSRQPRRPVRMRLVPYLELLAQVTPRDFERDFVQEMAREEVPGRSVQSEAVFLISANIGLSTCQTCRVLAGRVLTESAIEFAKTQLNPPLFHPRCRHVFRSGGLRGVPLAQYDSKTHGDLVTVAVLRALVRSGELATRRAR